MSAVVTTQGCNGSGALLLCQPCGLTRWRLDPVELERQRDTHNNDKHKEA